MKISFESTLCTTFCTDIKLEALGWWRCLALSVLVQLFNLVDVLGVELGNVFPKVPLNLLQHNHRLRPVHQVDCQTMLKKRKDRKGIKLKVETFPNLPVRPILCKYVSQSALPLTSTGRSKFTTMVT